MKRTSPRSKNQGRNQRQFQEGDLVIVQKQVQTKTVDETVFPAKQQIAKYKGPYKVIEKLGNKSYRVQKLPTLQGQGRPGKLLKFSATNMTKIPSTLIVHKRLDTQDTRLAALEKPLVTNPLEQALGFHSFGKYVQVPDQNKFAFDKVESLWHQELQSDSDSTIDDESSEASNASQSEDEGDVMPEDTVVTQEDSQLNQKNQQNVSQESLPPQKRPPDPNFVPPQAKKAKPTCLVKGIEQKLSLQQFYEAVKASKDKMFIIVSDQGNDPFYVVRVNWDKTSQKSATGNGTYHVEWYIRHVDDCRKLPLRQCRFWPLVQSPNEFDYLDVIHPVKPTKLDTTLEKLKDHGWVLYQLKINLFKQRLVGPIDFEARSGKTHYIPDKVWTELQAQASQINLDVSCINKKRPLRSTRSSATAPNSQSI